MAIGLELVTMAALRLNLDILTLILYETRKRERRDDAFLPMMQTCRALYACGVPLLLDHAGDFQAQYCILDDSNAESFIAFMDSEIGVGRRHCWLRQVTFAGDMGVPSPYISMAQKDQVDTALAAVLSQARNLQALLIDSEAFLLDKPRGRIISNMH